MLFQCQNPTPVQVTTMSVLPSSNLRPVRQLYETVAAYGNSPVMCGITDTAPVKPGRDDPSHSIAATNALFTSTGGLQLRYMSRTDSPSRWPDPTARQVGPSATLIIRRYHPSPVTDGYQWRVTGGTDGPTWRPCGAWRAVVLRGFYQQTYVRNVSLNFSKGTHTV